MKALRGLCVAVTLAVLGAACGPYSPTPDGGLLPDGGLVNPDAGPHLASLHGRITTHNQGPGLPNAMVSVGSASTTTADDGTFTLNSVALPYDLRVTYTYQAKTRVEIVEGLTRTDPTLEVNTASEAAVKSALVTGTLSGLTFPLAAGHHVTVTTSGVGSTTVGTVDPSSGSYMLTATWQSDATTAKNLYALEYEEDADGLPIAFGGYGKISPSLTAGGTLTGQNIALSAPSQGNVNAVVAQSAPLDGLSAFLGLDFEPNCQFALSRYVTGDFSGVLPSIAGVSAFAAISASYTAAAGLGFDKASDLALGATASLDTHTPLVLTPANNATFPPGSSLGWNAQPHGIYELQLTDTGGATTLVLFTARTSVTLPADLPLSSGTHSWWVESWFDAATTDAIAVPGGPSGTAPHLNATAQSIVVP